MATKRGTDTQRTKPGQDPVDKRLLRALSHPLRQRILRSLDQGEASPAQLSRELGEPIGNVSYHVKVLSQLGAIELVRTAPVRGALEHFYVGALDTAFDDADTNVSVTNLELDEQGYKAVAKTMAEALDRVKRIQAEASKRLAAAPENSRGGRRTEIVMVQVERAAGEATDAGKDAGRLARSKQGAAPKRQGTTASKKEDRATRSGKR